MLGSQDIVATSVNTGELHVTDLVLYQKKQRWLLIWLYQSLPYELKLIIHEYIRRWQWEVCISRMHKLPAWLASYSYRKYRWLYDDPEARGVTVQSLTHTNRAKYDIADSLRYQDFISGKGLVRSIVPMWRQFRMEPTVKDLLRLPYSTNVLAYGFRECLANYYTARVVLNSTAGQSEIDLQRYRSPAYYSKDMLGAVASDLVGSTQLMTRQAKLRARIL